MKKNVIILISAMILLIVTITITFAVTKYQNSTSHGGLNSLSVETDLKHPLSASDTGITVIEHLDIDTISEDDEINTWIENCNSSLIDTYVLYYTDKSLSETPVYSYLILRKNADKNSKAKISVEKGRQNNYITVNYSTSSSENFEIDVTYLQVTIPDSHDPDFDILIGGESIDIIKTIAGSPLKWE